MPMDPSGLAALLNAQSRRPNTSTVRATSRSTSADLDTSVGTKIALPPAAVISSTVCVPICSPRAAITTLAPPLANARAVALPMPELPPVTNATLPAKDSITASIAFNSMVRPVSGWAGFVAFPPKQGLDGAPIFVRIEAPRRSIGTVVSGRSARRFSCRRGPACRGRELVRGRFRCR